MRYLALLLSLIIFASCGTEADKPEPSIFPFNIGTFQVAAPDSADWKGGIVSNKLKGDTLVVSDTLSHRLSIVDNSNPEDLYFYFVFTDSTLNSEDISTEFFNPANHTIILPDFEEPESKTPFFVQTQLTNVLADTNYAKLSFETRISTCLEGDPITPDNNFEYSIFLDGEHFRTYIIEADGYVKASHFVVCEDSTLTP